MSIQLQIQMTLIKKKVCAHVSKYEVSIFVPLWLMELGATSHCVYCYF